MKQHDGRAEGGDLHRPTRLCLSRRGLERDLPGLLQLTLQGADLFGRFLGLRRGGPLRLLRLSELALALSDRGASLLRRRTGALEFAQPVLILPALLLLRRGLLGRGRANGRRLRGDGEATAASGTFTSRPFAHSSATSVWASTPWRVCSISCSTVSLTGCPAFRARAAAV
ncbi:hypothetical protein ACFYV5_12050 [Streptomyces sp. NPDC003035]|uniref:hypothetical protein n=1 Tax=Streptomyces sp. NPDC003035 TaxID=3364676 RepID=UPI0036CD3153